jgi:hypothetical protein
MKVQYKIEKPVGMYRPVLNIYWEYAPEEKALNPITNDITTEIIIVNGWSRTVNDAKTEEEKTAKLSLRPGIGNEPRTYYLPWREDNNYPEVEVGIKQIRDEMERALLEASRSHPFTASGEMGLTPEAEAELAPILVAIKLEKAS